jgi:LacI family transcriptional regulator
MELSLDALTYLRGAGIAVPGDVSLIGFDDPEWASISNPRLTAIATPAFRLGKLAAIRVCRSIRQGGVLPQRDSRLSPWLVERDSVAPPRLRRSSRQAASRRKKLA